MEKNLGEAMTHCLIDTCVFCNVLNVPGRNQKHAEVICRLKPLTEE